MHPPFIFPNHPVGPTNVSPTPERTVVRRSKPEALRLTPASAGFPPMPLVVPQDDRPAPKAEAIRPRDKLSVVPVPRNALRDRIGRFLIRVGQRMILQDRPG